MPTLKELSLATRTALDAEGMEIPEVVAHLPNDFEMWLSVLADEQPWLSESENLRNKALFVDVSRHIFEVIQSLSIRVFSESIPVWLSQLVRYWIETSSTVITFNYDTIIEVAYQEVANEGRGAESLHASDARWWRDLYRLPLTLAGERAGDMIGPDRQPSFPLLKLHGSTNWFYSGAGSGPNDVILDSGVWNRWGAELVPGVSEVDDWTEDKVPLIVPPTTSKNRYYGNQALRVQWQRARRALREADELFVLGYSVPSSDVLVRALIASEFNGDVVVPVDVGKGPAASLKEVLGTKGLADAVDDSFVGCSDAIEKFVHFRCNAGP